jgi:uncharacterized protein (DUF2236 family)
MTRKAPVITIMTPKIRRGNKRYFAYIDSSEVDRIKETGMPITVRVFGDPSDRQMIYAATKARKAHSVIRGRFWYHLLRKPAN